MPISSLRILGVSNLLRYVVPNIVVVAGLGLLAIVDMDFPNGRPNVDAVLDKLALHTMVLTIIIDHKRREDDQQRSSTRLCDNTAFLDSTS